MVEIYFELRLKKWSWLKAVLRQIEIDVLTNKVPNLKDELLKWVKE